MMNQKNNISAIKESISLKSKLFWDINDTDIQKFINNFKEYDKDLGYILLDMMIFYNTIQCVELAKKGVEELNHCIWFNAVKKGLIFNSSQEIIEYIKDYLSKSYIFPVSNKDESGTSSEIMEGYYRSLGSFDIPVDNYKAITSLPEIIAKKTAKSIVFVDDVIGTGKQFTEFMEKQSLFSMNTSICELVNSNTDVDFYYLVFISDKKSFDELTKKYQNLHIVSVEIISNYDRITSEKNEYWELNSNLSFKWFINKLNEINKSFPRKCEFSLDLPIIYQSGRAQNTSFEYYWNDYDHQWHTLKAR